MSIASEITRINNNIAAAYTACRDKGALLPQTQNSANLADTIAGVGGIPQDFVSFYDYDGTRLYSYSAAQAAALTELPALPSHAGLTAQGWTHTLAQIQSSVQNGRRIDVGATHTTSDGSTRLYLFVAKGTRIPALQLWVTMDANQTSTVDWGDGTTGTLQNTGASSSAVYAEKTDYTEAASDTTLCVRITGGSFILGRSNTEYTVFGTLSTDNSQMSNMPVLAKAELGANCKGIATSALRNCFSMTSIVVPNTVTSVSTSSFYNCRSLAAVIIPYGVAEIQSSAFSNCNCLKTVVLPESVAVINSYAFNNTESLPLIVFPNGISSFKANAFFNSRNLLKIEIPGAVTSIAENAFSACYKLYSVDLTAYTDPTSIPSLANVNAFSSTPAYLKFKVANQSMLTAFTSATNWSSFASQFAVSA